MFLTSSKCATGKFSLPPLVPLTAVVDMHRSKSYVEGRAALMVGAGGVSGEVLKKMLQLGEKYVECS